MKERLIVLRGGGPDASATAFRGPQRLDTGSPGLHCEVVEADEKEKARLSRDPATRALAPPMPLGLVEPVGAPQASRQTAAEVAWGVAAVGADRSPFDGEGVTVAVLDTGLAVSVQADCFAGLAIERRNFTEGPDDDVDGHGTHCAGTFFGRDGYGTRVGVAPGVARALVGKVLGPGASTEGVVRAIDWARDGGAQVIAMSLAVDFPGRVRQLVEREGMPVDWATSRALHDYLATVRLFEAIARGLKTRTSEACLLVAAAGNESRELQGKRFTMGVAAPAVADGLVSVAAVGRGPKGLVAAPFSNIGARVCAPGVDVVSVHARVGLWSRSGTSMAVPHVAGVAALWLQRERQRAHRGAAPIGTDTLVARLVGHATTEGLALEADGDVVGDGLVQAPRS